MFNIPELKTSMAMKTYNIKFFFLLSPGFSFSNVASNYVQKNLKRVLCETETYRSLQQNKKGKGKKNSVAKRSHALASYLLQTVQLT